MSSIITHTLPSGAKASLRPFAEITERHRRPIEALQMRLAKDEAFSGVVKDASEKGVEAAKNLSEAEASLMMASMGEDSLDLMNQMNDRLILARVVQWTYVETELTAEGLLDLPSGDYKRLRELCAEGSLDTPDFSPSTAEDSPTVPSTASVSR